MTAPSAAVPGRGVPTSALVLLGLLALAWGTFWPASKFVMQEMPILTFRAVCGEVAGICLLAIAAANGRSLRIPRGDFWHLLLVALLSSTGWLYFSAVAVMTMGAGRAALLAYTMPLWAFLLGIWLLGERPTGRRWFGLAIGLGGVAALVAEDVGRILAHPLGASASLLGALSWAAGSVLFKRRQWTMPDLSLVGWQQLIGGVPLALAALLFDGGQWQGLSAAAGVALVYNIAAGGVFGVWAWFRIVRMLPIGVATLGVLMVPVVGLLSSSMLIGEALTPYSLVALALILLALTTVMPVPRIPLPWRRSATPD